jgi:hypothetical protein
MTRTNMGCRGCYHLEISKTMGDICRIGNRQLKNKFFDCRDFKPKPVGIIAKVKKYLTK